MPDHGLLSIIVSLTSCVYIASICWHTTRHADLKPNKNYVWESIVSFAQVFWSSEVNTAIRKVYSFHELVFAFLLFSVLTLLIFIDFTIMQYVLKELWNHSSFQNRPVISVFRLLHSVNFINFGICWSEIMWQNINNVCVQNLLV